MSRSLQQQGNKINVAASFQLQRSKYRVLGLVGQGQFGQVFCAVHRKTGQLVALKNLDRYRFPTHKFLRELRFLLSLEHPNIVTCRALEHTSKGRYLVMDYCEAGTLRQLIEGEMPLPLTQKIELVLALLAGLQHAHSRAIIHCDIKPENILLSLGPNGWCPRISDFGIARLAQGETNDPSGNTGSPAYMAPERFYGQVSVSSDLYGIGVLLYELLIGRRPFSGTPMELMSAHLNQPVRFPAALPAELQNILRIALQKLPARRFGSAATLSEALRALPQTLLETADQSAWLQSPYKDEDLPECALATDDFCDFTAQVCQTVKAPILSLVAAECSCEPASQEASIASQWMAQATTTQVVGTKYADTLLSGQVLETLPYSSRSQPITHLVGNPQGCLIVTHQSVEWFPWATVSPQQPATTYRLFEFQQSGLVAAHASGRWAAIATPETLSIISRSSWRSAPDPLEALASLTAEPTRSPRVVSHQSKAPSQLIWLEDSRHLLLSSTRPAKLGNPAASSSSVSTTQLEIFTRRGQWLGALALPTSIRQVIPTTMPYRLMALEPDHPQGILLIDLKPFRLLRIALPIVPACMTATNWGYAIADQQGQILLLNHETERVGQIAGPAQPTAIASFDGYGLLVATWSEVQGNLYTVDLRQLAIDLIF